MQDVPNVLGQSPAPHHLDMDSESTSTRSATETPDTSLTQKGSMKSVRPLFIGLCLAVIVAGTATGMGIKKLNAKTSGVVSEDGSPIQQVATDNIKNGDVFGSSNEAAFKDAVEGYVEIGGLDGEGSHKLLRAGGPSQTVYLTSSSTDLDKFQGMEVKIWGETFKGQKVGWLMDVGRVKIIKTNGEVPEGNEAAKTTGNEGGGE